jgi:hypothetical protein
MAQIATCPVCRGIVATTARACPHCGYIPPWIAQAQQAFSFASGVLVAAGVLIGVGAFMPWVTVSTGFGTVSAAGTQGVDGYIALALGIVVALLGLAGISRRGLPANRLTIWLLGAVVFGLAFVEGMDLERRLQSLGLLGDLATVGVGIYAIGLGGGLTMAAASWGKRAAA